jgi:enoyl-CoA hydratase/carnithine racemase
MLHHLQPHAIAIGIGAAFYLFGFFVVADALSLAYREILIGLVAGFIGGLTMLVFTLGQQREFDSYSDASGTSAQ